MATTDLVQESTMQTLLANVERLAIAQQQYISKYNPGYNINLSQDEDGYIILEPGDPVSGEGEISLQAKTNISPTESSQTIRADSGYDGLSSVQINAIPGNYVGSTVTRKAAATYTPSETAQTIAAGQYLSGAQTISAVSSTYIGSGVTRKAAATYTPGTTDQTIAAGQYLNGAQTIKGDSNLVAANIASGVSIFGIQGTHSGGSGGSISITDQPNATGTTLVVTGDGSSSPSATQHSIYFEFSDSTNTTIPVYYDDALLGTMITAYKPVTYGGKTVTLAQLDGVTWYEPAVIPLNTQLIDYSKVTANTVINSQGQTESTQWYYTSDYTVVNSGMTFAYTASYWHYIGIYDENKDVLRTIYAYQDATVNPDDSNLGDGTLSGNELTNAKYVRICSTHQSSPGMSLIRTA